MIVGIETYRDATWLAAADKEKAIKRVKKMRRSARRGK